MKNRNFDNIISKWLTIFRNLPTFLKLSKLTDNSMESAELFLLKRYYQGLKASCMLLNKCYYPESNAILRTVVECVNMIKFLRKDNIHLEKFLTLKGVDYTNYFQPKKIRKAIGATDKEEKYYHKLSNLGVHATYASRAFMPLVRNDKLTFDSSGNDISKYMINDCPEHFKPTLLALQLSILGVVFHMVMTMLDKNDAIGKVLLEKKTVRLKKYMIKLVKLARDTEIERTKIDKTYNEEVSILRERSGF